jgi:hypothetical protein
MYDLFGIIRSHQFLTTLSRLLNCTFSCQQVYQPRRPTTPKNYTQTDKHLQQYFLTFVGQIRELSPVFIQCHMMHFHILFLDPACANYRGTLDLRNITIPLAY